MYVGMAVDLANKTTAEKQLESQGGGTQVQPLITATIQIVPLKSVGRGQQQAESGSIKKYLNVSETGNSIFEIMRNYSLKRDRAVIGHHLKVFVISTELAEKIELHKLLDFLLRDNDIRPSSMVFLSRGKAMDTLESDEPDEIPAFRIRDMVRNKFRNNKIYKEVILTNLDGYFHAKQSFILQNIAAADTGEIEFTGAGIIKGSTNKWIGDLDQENLSAISWIQGDSSGGLLKTVNDRNSIITYEILSGESKIIPKVDGERLSFHVDIKTEGRLIETWDAEETASKAFFLKEAEQKFEQKLETMLQNLMKKMQTEYKVEVAGFGDRLRITHPKVWKKVKDDWDDIFSRATVSFDISLKITDYGSSTE
ncbi:germination protein BC [Paenibacillus montaniterrae]|uniref:Germination protein BC n=1 Tax=Paenibacillus montaniterrae TaxID=429341 RepID=A0A919YS14_9BACL|nr:germination protein BC [Paenibacillus montaniterrae]